MVKTLWHVRRKWCRKNANLVFFKLGGFGLHGHVPHIHGLVIGEACNVFAIQQEVWSMCNILLGFERPQKHFTRDAEDLNFAIVASNIQKLTVGLKFPAKSSFSKFCQTFVDIVWKWIENLDLKINLSLR